MRLWLFLFGLLAIFAGVVAFNLLSFNQFSSIDPVALARCEPVAGITGPEDIEIDGPRGRAFISSLDRRAEDARGAIHVFDLEDPLSDAGWRDRTLGAPEDFKPLGLDFYDDGEARRLFVVNEAGPSVEMFDVRENGDLVHLETFKERRLTSPNNVVAVGPRSFYVTNDVRPGRKARIADLHFLMRVGSGEVFLVDGVVWRVVADGLRFANGITLSPSGDKLYVAETAGKAVRAYDRNPENGALTPAEKFSLKVSPDNINVDADGFIWVGALPQPLSVPSLLKDESATAASEVLRIDQNGKATTIYRDDGEEYSAATVAARSKGKLLIGALYEPKFLLCDLPKSSD